MKIWQIPGLYFRSKKEGKMTKAALQSMTLWGLGISALPFLAKKVGLDLDETSAEKAMNTIVWAVGVALAIIGRFRAKGPIKGIIK